MNRLARGSRFGAQLGLLGLFLCAALVQAREDPIQVEGELYRGDAVTDHAQQERKRPRAKAYQVPAPRILLAPITADELDQIHRDRGGKRQPVGVGRALPAPYTEHLDPGSLAWSVLPEGGRTAVFAVTSPGAASLRLQLVFRSLPEGVELRFFNPAAPADAVGPLTRALLLQGAAPGTGPRDYWSPVIDGDTLAVEIYLPPDVEPAALEFALPRISHLVTSPRSESRSGLEKVGESGSCSVDVACDTTGVPASAVSGVAKYTFSDSAGASFLCTGTLLNDTDDTTQIPYFLTANHCIDSQALASTMDISWFYQRSGCGFGTVSPVRQSGGATLLATGAAPAAPDFTLVRLNQAPPVGVGLTGWTSASVADGSAVTSVHHPAGDIKKISYGTALGLVPFPEPSLPHAFIQVGWHSGVTEPGSSGAGLWTGTGTGMQLVGTLWGGESDCTYPQGVDFFGRFDFAFSSLRTWLAPNFVPTSGMVHIHGNVRYGSLPACALVLANGQHMFSCDGGGSYSLEVPRDTDGGITLFGFADGFAPAADTVYPAGDLWLADINLEIADTVVRPRVAIDALIMGSDGRVTLAGTITYGGLPVCALVLANGQHMFSCQGGGAYELNVPADVRGQITLFVFVDGFAPFSFIFDPRTLVVPLIVAD
jgi:hypothetical protein